MTVVEKTCVVVVFMPFLFMHFFLLIYGGTQ